MSIKQGAWDKLQVHPLGSFNVYRRLHLEATLSLPDTEGDIKEIPLRKV